MSKPYDIVLYGASGFTGKLCARYLQNCSSASTNKFAIAGRSENKLKAVAQDIGAPDTPILIADSQDEDALREMVRKTRVVITTAGPYTLYGSTLVKVCAENGVHCVDLTGEPTWTHDMQKLYGDAAKQSKAIFIHGAGFDSMPGDLSTYLAVKKLRSATKASCGLVTSGYSLKGGMSGGTFNTLLVISKQAKDAQKAAVLRDPYSLSPVRGSDKPKPSLTYRDGDRVGGYFVMESANAPVVRQTWGILEEAAKKDPNHFSYGPEFKYREFQMTPNRFWAGLMSVSIFSFFLLLAKFPFFHRMAQKYGLQSGDGPTESQMTNGSFKVISVARDVENKVFAKTVMKARGDPGYLGTSIMICEAALGLAHDYDRLTDTAKEGGHLTAATIFGDGVLKERLEKTGRFEWDTQLVDHP